MQINLRSASKADWQTVTLVLNERLPERFILPCSVQCSYKVEVVDVYYLLHLQLHANLELVCQRCLGVFSSTYINDTIVAVCSSEEMAEQLLVHYESIVCENDQINLTEVLTDELILGAEQMHFSSKDCDKEAEQYILSR